MIKHYTSGPWSAAANFYDFAITDAHDNIVATVFNERDGEAAQADAHLITAAPDLLETAQAALKVLVKLCNNHTEGQYGYICNDLHNAICKARGGE